MTTATSSTARRALVVGLGGLVATVAFASSAAPTLAANARGLPPPSQVRMTDTLANATYTPKPKLKHHQPKPKPRHHPRRHHAAHTYVYQLAFPQYAAGAASCSTAPYTMIADVGAVNANAQPLLGNGFPTTTIRFQPGQTLFKVTDAPSESLNAQLVHSICDFAAIDNGGTTCAVSGVATYRTYTPVRSLAQLTSRPAYSITGVVDNVVGNFPCGNTPEMPPW
jgi:hypothetical protein